MVDQSSVGQMSVRHLAYLRRQNVVEIKSVDELSWSRYPRKPNENVNFWLVNEKNFNIFKSDSQSGFHWDGEVIYSLTYLAFYVSTYLFYIIMHLHIVKISQEPDG